MFRFADLARPLVCALTVLLTLPAAAAAACSGADAVPTAATTGAAASATVCVVNEQRAAHGLRRLEPNAKLARVAGRYSGEMARHHFFSHVSPNGRGLADRINASGFAPAGRWRAGEALGWGTGQSATPAAMVDAWLSSPPHRAILLDRGFVAIGVGVAPRAPQGQAGATYTLEAARRG